MTPQDPLILHQVTLATTTEERLKGSVKRNISLIVFFFFLCLSISFRANKQLLIAVVPRTPHN